MCGLQTRPLTDVDPPRVELPSAGGISSRRPRGDILFGCVLRFEDRITLHKLDRPNVVNKRAHKNTKTAPISCSSAVATGQTSRRTPYRYIDPTPHTAASANDVHCTIPCSRTDFSNFAYCRPTLFIVLQTVSLYFCVKR